MFSFLYTLYSGLENNNLSYVYLYLKLCMLVLFVVPYFIFLGFWYTY